MSEPDDPVSPELVLVDPELAASARERLPDVANGRVAPAGTPPPVRPADEPKSITPWTRYDEPPAPATRRLPKAVLVALAVAGLVGGLALARELSTGSTATDTRATPSGTGSRSAASRTTERGARVRTTPSSPSSSTTRPNRDRPAKPAPGSSRVFVWPAVKGASFYRVEFFRRRRKVFAASPARPRLALPKHWSYRGRPYRLLEGPYRWKVRPAFGSRAAARYGAPITVSVWLYTGPG